MKRKKKESDVKGVVVVWNIFSRLNAIFRPRIHLCRLPYHLWGCINANSAERFIGGVMILQCTATNINNAFICDELVKRKISHAIEHIEKSYFFFIKVGEFKNDFR